MYELDYARNLAYKGDRGFYIHLCPQGLYVVDGKRKVLLTSKNSKVFKVQECKKTI